MTTTLHLKNQRVTLQTRDALLTTSARLTAEPAPEVRPGEMGVRLTGSGMVPRQVDITAMRSLRDTGLLSPAAVAEIDQILAKYSGSSRGRTSAGGITSTDEARTAVAEIAANIDNNKAVARTYKDFWDANAAAFRDADHGR
jgi:hypothetical protein